MFATVECKDADGGLAGFLKDIFTMPEIEFCQVKIPSGSWFYKVSVKEYRGQIPVEETVQKLKRLKKSVLFDINFPLDESTGGLEFSPSEFTALLLFNSAADYIRQQKIDPLEASLAVFDPEGFYAGVLEAMVPLFSKISVYTRSPEAYTEPSVQLMDKYGICLAVSDSLSGKAPDCTAAICHGEVPFADFFKGLLFTNAEKNPPCGCCVRGYGIDLPGEYELIRPNGIGRMYFAAALYEKGGVKSLGRLSYKKLRLT